MTDTPRELLSRELGGVPVPDDLNFADLARKLSNATSMQRTAELRAKAEAEAAVAKARHEELSDRIGPGLLQDILDHHAPVPVDSGWRIDVNCHGCDGWDYDGDAPDWPCSTWDMIWHGMDK